MNEIENFSIHFWQTIEQSSDIENVFPKSFYDRDEKISNKIKNFIHNTKKDK
jgi:truncated hemoglobin YjbI